MIPMSNLPQIDKTALGKENNVTARRHRETVNLRLDIDDLLSVGFQPRNVDLDIEMPDAEIIVRLSHSAIHNGYATYLLTIASSSMTSKCLAVIMSLLPVVVTKILARGAASSIVVTS
jgi:hypothetical protein